MGTADKPYGLTGGSNLLCASSIPYAVQLRIPLV